MKQFIAILALSVSIFTSAQAQYFFPSFPDNRFTIGFGGGYGSKDKGALANLQVEYNITRVVIGYSQTMFVSDSKPAFFEGKIGYQMGNNYSITPHAGYAYMVKDLSQGDGSTHISYGAELTARIDQLIYADPQFYMDYNRVGRYNLYVIGLKASF